MPELKGLLTAFYNHGFNKGYEVGTAKKWHFTEDNEYPPEGQLVFCHGWLRTPYGSNKIAEKSFIGYYKGSYGWFIKNSIDGESDQSWPVDEWRELDMPVKRVES